jgi:hypothetical protein
MKTTPARGTKCRSTVGAPASDSNTGAFTARLELDKTVTIGHHHVHVGRKTYANVKMRDVLKALTSKLAWRDWPRIRARTFDKNQVSGAEPITAEALYPRCLTGASWPFCGLEQSDSLLRSQKLFFAFESALRCPTSSYCVVVACGAPGNGCRNRDFHRSAKPFGIDG